jgi:hypothetical protein
MADIARLEPLVGEWRLEVPAFPVPEGATARATFEWALRGAFLLERDEVSADEAPDGLKVIAATDDGYLQHYFDQRGVVRLYAMTFDGREWTLERHAADFSPLPFHQRWTATVEADLISGRWETSADGRAWELDFELFYHRVA